MTHNDPGWLTMVQDDIPGVRGAPGGPGGRQGAPGGSSLPMVQSMSWPKGGGSYSFLGLLGPFGLIATVIFSENAYLSKTRFEEKSYLFIYTDHTQQFSVGFAIFHTRWDVQRVWKIDKKHNPIVQFCCVDGQLVFDFFQKIIFDFSKDLKKYKNIITIPKKLKSTHHYLYFDIYFSELIIGATGATSGHVKFLSAV